MRGAGMRLKHDVRRLWRCSACGAERKAGAETTALRCVCPGQPAMKLIETQRASRELKELASPYLEFEFEPGELAAPGSFCRPVEAEQPPENAPQQEASDFGEGVELPAAPPTQPSTRPDNRRSGPPRQQSRGPGPAQRNENRPSDRPRRDGPPSDRPRGGPGGGPTTSGPKNGPGGPPPQGERRPPRDRPRKDRPPRGPQTGPGESGGPPPVPPAE